VDNGKAVRTALQLGLRGDELVEVLKKGGKDGAWDDVTGEEFIIVNSTGLTDGQAIQWEPSKQN
jgi:hypothetical protein